jgi:hypothetical protein
MLLMNESERVSEPSDDYQYFPQSVACSSPGFLCFRLRSVPRTSYFGPQKNGLAEEIESLGELFNDTFAVRRAKLSQSMKHLPHTPPTRKPAMCRKIRLKASFEFALRLRNLSARFGGGKSEKRC